MTLLVAVQTDHAPSPAVAGSGATRGTRDGPAGLPVALVATTTNAFTVADGGGRLLEGFSVMLARPMEQLETETIATRGLHERINTSSGAPFMSLKSTTPGRRGRG